MNNQYDNEAFYCIFWRKSLEIQQNRSWCDVVRAWVTFPPRKPEWQCHQARPDLPDIWKYLFKVLVKDTEECFNLILVRLTIPSCNQDSCFYTSFTIIRSWDSFLMPFLLPYIVTLCISIQILSWLTFTETSLGIALR